MPKDQTNVRLDQISEASFQYGVGRVRIQAVQEATMKD